MIADTLNNASQYMNLSHGIAAALNFLKTQDLKNLSLGRHDIDGDNCFALVQVYDTKPTNQGKWEAHRKYLDVQFVVDGAERMGYAPVTTLAITNEYDPSLDVAFFQGEGDFLTIQAGSFAIFAPQDAHMPQMAVCQPQSVRKIVVKVRVD
jgi:YhcH/YjgK/YiaL family protein